MLHTHLYMKKGGTRTRSVDVMIGKSVILLLSFCFENEHVNGYLKTMFFFSFKAEKDGQVK